MHRLMLSICLTITLFALTMPALAGPVITVGDVEGGDSECDYKYQNLLGAINEALGMGPGEEVVIRLAVPGGFATLERSIDDPPRDIRFHGGFQACGDESPDSSDPTQIRLPNSSGNRLFSISADPANARRAVTFDHVILDGQEHDNGIDEGGLIHVAGPIDLVIYSSTLDGGRVSAIDSDDARGGAVYLGAEARLETIRRTRIQNNSAGAGGAIYCDNDAEVVLGSNDIRDNSAGSGGAIYLAVGCRQLELINASSPFSPRHRLIGNTAAFAGGAILSLGVDITTGDPDQLAFRHLQLSSNNAEVGGAIYMTGDPSNPAQLDLADTVITANSAQEVGGVLYLSQGVEARIRQYRPRDPACPNSAGKSCSWFWKNTAGALTDGHGGGFAYLDNGVNGLPRLTLERVHLEDNASDGMSAVVHQASDTTLVIHNSLISDRIGDGADYLFTADSANSLVLMYNTIADLNGSAGIRTLGDMNVHVTGSLYWNGNEPLWTDAGGQASLHHGDCLLTSTVENLPNPGALITDDPRLSSDYFLAGNSPAVNICDERHQDLLPDGAMAVDIKFEPRDTNPFDGPEQFGPFDLGAAALLAQLFRDRFEQ